MIVVGIDPGRRAPAHVALDLGGQVMGAASVPLSGGIGAAFVEGQFPNPKAARQSLMTLSFYAGIQIGCYMDRGIDCYILQPDTWKNWHQQGGSTMPKQVFQNRMRAKVPDPIWFMGEDTTDAFFIALTGVEMLQAGKKMRKLGWHK